VILVCDEIGFRDNSSAVLQVNKAMRTLKMEFHLLGVKEVKDRDVVFPKSKVLKGIAKCCGIGKKV
jgi:hypothetical protein